jgi:hypothetical protein
MEPKNMNQEYQAMAGYKRRPTKPRESFTRILTEIENQM